MQSEHQDINNTGRKDKIRQGCGWNRSTDGPLKAVHEEKERSHMQLSGMRQVVVEYIIANQEGPNTSDSAICIHSNGGGNGGSSSASSVGRGSDGGGGGSGGGGS